MLNRTDPVLVADAQTAQGVAIAHGLLQSGVTVRLLTRDLADPAADRLRLRGARLVWLTSDDAAAVADAVRGVHTLIVAPAPDDAPHHAARRLALIEGAARGGVAHVVLGSLAAAHQFTGVPHLDNHHEAERYVRASGVPFTVVSPVCEMEQLTQEPLLGSLRRGELPFGDMNGQPLQLVARGDVVRFVRVVLERAAELAGRRLVIASDELSAIEAAAALARALQRSIRLVGMDDVQLEPWLACTLRDAAVAARADVVALRARFPEVDWHTLDGWAHRQHWQ